MKNLTLTIKLERGVFQEWKKKNRGVLSKTLFLQKVKTLNLLELDQQRIIVLVLKYCEVIPFNTNRVVQKIPQERSTTWHTRASLDSLSKGEDEQEVTDLDENQKDSAGEEENSGLSGSSKGKPKLKE
ncbi:hypothetical protein FQR65_LT01045 [Abscondita terminalis]|nr:hypothetical protein FQR65_LT01045 [Abscondita terminalis]